MVEADGKLRASSHEYRTEKGRFGENYLQFVNNVTYSPALVAPQLAEIRPVSSLASHFHTVSNPRSPHTRSVRRSHASVFIGGWR